jgi:undecaprenyl phosphate N,N'-diacetylbacillosamine 1-phosphate transferase
VSEVITNHPKRISCKILFDIIMSIIGLILLAPFWIVIWFVILFEDGLPVLIKQKRIGKNGKLFDAYKFRSMHKSSLAAEVNMQAEENDSRITKIGRLLRNTAMDESPQLINILLGQMSFVGPRPLLKSEVEVSKASDETDMTKVPGYEQRIAIQPGLTGLAQLYHSRDIPREDKFKCDLEYAEKRSLWLDLKLIVLSVLVTFLGRWESRNTKLSLLDRSH